MARTPLKSPLAVLSVFCFIHAAVAVDFVVVNTNATGPGSLAQAITDANNLPGADRIVFNIPGTGVQKIDVSPNFLPAITDTLTIDGYTQPGAKPNTLAMGSNAVILIQIDGADYVTTYPNYSAPTGLSLNADGCMVRGLMITRFNVFQFGLGGGGRQGGYGIVVGANHCVIEGNFIGTDGSPSNNLGNREAGISVSGDNRIGGNTPAARNVIGGNSIGILAQGSSNGSDRVSIVGNQIGTNPSSTSSGIVEGRANSIGVSLIGTFTGTVVGGTDASSANLISGNGIGIRTAYTNNGTAQTTVGNGVKMKGNLIGLQPNRVGTEQVNQTIGIEILGTNHLIGGLETGAGNRIAFNQTGIAVETFGFGATILSNGIYSNGKIGIDLVANNVTGPTSNDLGDADHGPNELQNFPTITTVDTTGGNTTITGSLNSRPSSTFTLQFFGNLQGDPDQRLLNTQTVSTDANGYTTFQVVYPGTLVKTSLTATATDAAGNTSELLPLNGPVQFANLSTRAFVGTGDNIMIGGFIIRTNSVKKVIVRALGPSLNLPRRLADPYLEIYDNTGSLVSKNDDWKTGQQQEVMNSGLAPSNDLESAIVISLAAGNYTAQVRDARGGTGTGLVEVYDLGSFPADTGRLVNISTRGFVGNGDDVLIGGFIVRGDDAVPVIIRAMGPDLQAAGVPGALADPTLELRNLDGILLASNDNWRDSNEQQIKDTQLAPNDDRDSAILAPLAPGNYTAIVRGKNGATGLALVEFYDLKQ